MTALSEMIERRYGRRGFLALCARGLACTSALAVYPSYTQAFEGVAFEPIPTSVSEDVTVAQGFDTQVLLRWQDSIGSQFSFGYNNDFIAYMPIDGRSDHGLLCVNHEYTSTALMFPGLTPKTAMNEITQQQAEVEMRAHGHSVVEIRRMGAQWQVVDASPYHRRLDGFETRFELSGPVAGHRRVCTHTDPTGRDVIGTYGNCSGGVTPWGTVLFAEENFDTYFKGTANAHEKANYERLDIGRSTRYGWYRFEERFQLEKEPHEANRFGWVVEYDPYNPKSQPKKRTALGRFKHEGAHCTLTRDRRAVIYMGDDEHFEFVYRFISDHSFSADGNDDLLDSGVLSVARFDEDGSVEWLPLRYGMGPLTEKEGFYSQADILIETRRAATLLGATPMDRPEDIRVNPVTGDIFVVLTNNAKRLMLNAANPRLFNVHGHILRLQPQHDHDAQYYNWELFYLADGKELSCPDNIVFDPKGRLWVATDGMNKVMNVNDGLYLYDNKGVMRRFFNAPKGAEVTGPAFTPDGKTLFLSIQHPGEGGTYDAPKTRWPDFEATTPPKPSVVAITGF